METASNSEFKLIGSSSTEYPSSAITLSCNVSPELSAVDLEIRWFKETECVYLYKNRQVTEGKSYEERVSLFRDELEKGNISLQLKNCSWSDLGDYLCQVTDGDTTEELTVRMTRDPWVFVRPFWGAPRRDSGKPVSFDDDDDEDGDGAPRRDSGKPVSFDDHDEDGDGALIPPLRRVFTKQSHRQWTNEERLKMEKSSFLIEHKLDENSLISEFKKKCSSLEKTQKELRNTKLELEQVMETNQKKLETLEKELQDKNSHILRLLSERERQQMDKDKFEEEQLQKCTDPDPLVPIRRKNSNADLPPKMSGESSGVDPLE